MIILEENKWSYPYAPAFFKSMERYRAEKEAERIKKEKEADEVIIEENLEEETITFTFVWEKRAFEKQIFPISHFLFENYYE